MEYPLNLRYDLCNSDEIRVQKNNDSKNKEVAYVVIRKLSVIAKE